MTKTTESNPGGAGSPRTVETTPEGNVVSPHIGDPLYVIQEGVVDAVNEYLRSMSSMDKTGVLQSMEAVTGSEGPDDQSVYVHTRGPKKPGAKTVNMAILRISDHRDKQKKTEVEFRTLRVDDVIRWTHRGVDMGRWEDVADRTVRLKHKTDPEVTFMLDANSALAKTYDGLKMIIEMLNKFFKENGINVVL